MDFRARFDSNTQTHRPPPPPPSFIRFGRRRNTSCLRALGARKLLIDRRPTERPGRSQAKPAERVPPEAGRLLRLRLLAWARSRLARGAQGALVQSRN